MKILVIGSGGREHALVWKINQSKKVKKNYCAPGNPGTSLSAENISIKADQLDQLVEFATKEKIDLTVVGPEAPLIAGIVDLFEKNKLFIIGPSKKAAQIEGSKVFAKKLMLKYKIPTAKFAVFDEYSLAINFLKRSDLFGGPTSINSTNKFKFPLVIKADGQCLGKGVKVCKSPKEGQQFLKSLMVDKMFGNAANKVIIEECLYGQEVSFTVATDGKDFVSLLPSQDHKPVFDDDRGPNTGGMGAYAPVPFLGKKLIKRIEKEIIAPTISAMAEEGCLYKGILYPGLILTSEGPKVLEYNCRFGDPETQPLMYLLQTDLIDIFQAIINNKIKKLRLKWHKGSAICVVLASKDYPGTYEKGKIIHLQKPNSRAALGKGVVIFHSGTKRLGRKIVTAGGRVLGVTGRGKSLEEAIKNTYKIIGKTGINFSGMHYRKDIGKKGLNKKLWI